MPDIRITRDYAHPPDTVWLALTHPDLVPRWTATGRGGAPEGFKPEVGCRFRFVGRPVPGWDGIVRCEVLAAEAPSLLRYSWQGAENGPTTEVAYWLQRTSEGTRFTYEHTGFTGFGGLMMSALLGRVRRKMLDQGLAPLLDDLDPRPQGGLDQSGASLRR